MEKEETGDGGRASRRSAMGDVGRVGEFDQAKESWGRYVRRFKHYLVANDVDVDKDKKKAVSILVTTIGADVYGLLEGLTSPKDPADMTLTALIDVLDKHYSPRLHIVAQRHKFNSRSQKEGEAFADYVAELRKLVSTCEYNSALETMIRDRVVCGVRSETVRRRLLGEADLKLETAIQIAEATEDAERQCREISSGDNGYSGVNWVQPRGRAPFRGRNNFRGRRGVGRGAFPRNRGGGPVGSTQGCCHRCGDPSHFANDCWAKEISCNSCGKRGHLKRVCRGMNRGNTRGRGRGGNWTPPATHQVDDKEEFDVLEIREMKNEISSVTENGHRQAPYRTKLKMNGQEVTLEVDTGATVSLINEGTWLRLHRPHLQKTKRRLVTYTKHEVPVLGEVSLSIETDQGEKTVKAIVVKGQHSNLLGRDWLNQLQIDWTKVTQVNAVTTTNERNPQLQRLLEENEEIFKEELGHCQGIKAKIHIEQNAVPRFHKPRPIPFAMKEKVDADLDRLEKNGAIEKIPFADWAAPAVIVLKPSGEVRVCGDYKVTVNPYVKVEQYPIPRQEELFSALNGGKRFTQLDLAEAYLQVELDEESQKLLSINTHKGLFKYKRLPFGVSSAPAIFQKIMDQVVQGLTGVACYLDDIIVTGRTEEEHLKNLRAVLERLKKFGFRLKRRKCNFMMQQVKYLGHIIDSAGIRLSSEKVEAVLKAPRPTNQSELRSFLGGVNYFGKFIGNLSTIEGPLNKLLRNDEEWTWNKEAEKAFETLKSELASMDVLTHFDPNEKVGLACDASSIGIGAVLFHKYKDGTEKPIAYASKSLSNTERNYSQIEREALSIIYGTQKFHQYLFGRRFMLVTDHKPLLAIFGEKKGIPVLAASRLQRWALKLACYSYEIQFKPTAQHGNADCLSRLPCGRDRQFEEQETYESVVCQLQDQKIQQLPIQAEEIATRTREDADLQKVLQMIKTGKKDTSIEEGYQKRMDQLTEHRACILWGSRIVIPKSLRRHILQELHQSHAGMAKMKSLAREYVWWPNCDAEIESEVRRCTICATQSAEPSKAPLHHWEQPKGAWQRIHIDFAGPFASQMWLIVVDAYSKWLEVIPMKNNTTTKATVDTLRLLFAAHGLPIQLVSDNGPQYTSEEFRTFCTRSGIKHTLTAPYHPSSNGEAERCVQTFKKAMEKLLKDGKDVPTSLATFLLSYRTTPHGTTGKKPSELMGRKNLRTRLDILRERIQEKKWTIPVVSKGRTDKFDIGDKIWARNYRAGDRWVPAVVKKVLGPLTYRLTTCAGNVTWKRHLDQLKRRESGEIQGDDYDYWRSATTQRNEELPETHNDPVMENRPVTDETKNSREQRQRRVPVRYGFDEYDQ